MGNESVVTPLFEQGVGKAELARSFGVSRRTVYYWIETGQLGNIAHEACGNKIM